MKVKHLEKYLQKLNTELYSFSYALVGDDLVAEQLILDATYFLFTEKKDLIKKFDISSDNTKSAVRLFYYGQLYILAQNKISNIKAARLSDSNHESYFNLSLSKRAVLFLKHKTDFTYDELELIINLFKHEIIADLFSARELMILKDR